MTDRQFKVLASLLGLIALLLAVSLGIAVWQMRAASKWHAYVDAETDRRWGQLQTVRERQRSGHATEVSPLLPWYDPQTMGSDAEPDMRRAGMAVRRSVETEPNPFSLF